MLFLISDSFVTVGPGKRGVLMTFGSVHQGVLAPGLHFKVPFMQTVREMDVQIQKSNERQMAASKDLQDVTTTVAVNWSIDPADAEWVYQHIGSEQQLVTKMIDPVVANAVKAVTARYNAEALIAKREQIRTEMQSLIIKDLEKYKISVEGVNITDFKFSPEYTKAIEQKQVAQQKAQKASYDLERIKVEAQQQVAQAQGQAQAQKLVQSTLTPELIQMKAIEKWNGVLPQAVGGEGALPMLGIGKHAGVAVGTK
ncbi:MAG: prohibitin family protein [Xanthomonadales bacterium]|nr:prohibitin family protein [Xanthomonadales bacterium]